MTALADALVRYEAVWASIKPAGVLPLRPGIHEDATREALAREGLPAPAEILDWYAWHDGTDDRGASALPSRWQLLALDEALHQRRRLIQAGHRDAASLVAGEMSAEWYDPSHYWRPSWLPILLADMTYAAADLDAASPSVPVRFWAADEMELAHEGATPSMVSLFEYWIAVAQRCTRWQAKGDSGYWVVDEDRRPPYPPAFPYGFR